MRFQFVVALVLAACSSSPRIQPATPNTTSTATATALPSPTATPPATWFRTTYYKDVVGSPVFCTGEPYEPLDPTTIAASADGPPCGSRLRLCNDETCIEVTVKDRCGGCSSTHLDLSVAAWLALDQPAGAEGWMLPANPPALERRTGSRPANMRSRPSLP